MRLQYRDVQVRGMITTSGDSLTGAVKQPFHGLRDVPNWILFPVSLPSAP